MESYYYYIYIHTHTTSSTPPSSPLSTPPRLSSPHLVTQRPMHRACNLVYPFIVTSINSTSPRLIMQRPMRRACNLLPALTAPLTATPPRQFLCTVEHSHAPAQIDYIVLASSMPHTMSLQPRRRTVVRHCVPASTVARSNPPPKLCHKAGNPAHVSSSPLRCVSYNASALATMCHLAASRMPMNSSVLRVRLTLTHLKPPSLAPPPNVIHDKIDNHLPPILLSIYINIRSSRIPSPSLLP